MKLEVARRELDRKLLPNQDTLSIQAVIKHLRVTEDRSDRNWKLYSWSLRLFFTEGVWSPGLQARRAELLAVEKVRVASRMNMCSGWIIRKAVHVTHFASRIFMHCKYYCEGVGR